VRSITLWLWVALAGCVLQLVALVGFDFYEHESGKRENPFFGSPRRPWTTDTGRAESEVPAHSQTWS
jgi:hypothetical protein